jgi:hypothetical protein
MHVCTIVVLATTLFVALHARHVHRKAIMRTETKEMTAPGCADGNVVYGPSCYFFERERTFTWLQAKEFCAGMKATMWVPNCIDEWNAIREHATLIKNTWLGARAIDAEHEHVSLEWNKEEEGINERELPWLLHTDRHGYSGETKCLAYANHDADTSDLANFYMCDGPKFHVICEKNSTIVEPALDSLCESCLPCKETTMKKTETITKEETIKMEEIVEKPETTTMAPDTTTMALNMTTKI